MIVSISYSYPEDRSRSIFCSLQALPPLHQFYAYNSWISRVVRARRIYYESPHKPTLGLLFRITCAALSKGNWLHWSNKFHLFVVLCLVLCCCCYCLVIFLICLLLLFITIIFCYLSLLLLSSAKFYLLLLYHFKVKLSLSVLILLTLL